MTFWIIYSYILFVSSCPARVSYQMYHLHLMMVVGTGAATIPRALVDLKGPSSWSCNFWQSYGVSWLGVMSLPGPSSALRDVFQKACGSPTANGRVFLQNCRALCCALGLSQILCGIFSWSLLQSLFLLWALLECVSTFCVNQYISRYGMNMLWICSILETEKAHCFTFFVLESSRWNNLSLGSFELFWTWEDLSSCHVFFPLWNACVLWGPPECQLPLAHLAWSI